MDIYVATADFHLPVEGTMVTVGTVVSKYSGEVRTLVGLGSYTNCALYQWVGSPSSFQYLAFSGTVPDPTGSTVLSGSETVTFGDDFVTVSGAAFGFIPTTVVVTVVKPSAPNDNLFATVRLDSVTADGFTADLSAPASAVGYVLAYVVAA